LLTGWKTPYISTSFKALVFFPCLVMLIYYIRMFGRINSPDYWNTFEINVDEQSDLIKGATKFDSNVFPLEIEAFV
jgi:hypothetical protein